MHLDCRGAGLTAEVVDDNPLIYLVHASRRPDALNAQAADALIDVVRTYFLDETRHG